MSSGGLARHDVERLPLRQLLGELRADVGVVVVLGSWRAVTPDPLVPAVLARLQNFPGLTTLVDDREELLAHPSGLGLRLDLVAVDYPAAVAIRTVPGAAGHCAGKLLFGRGDDLERADAAGGSRTGGAVGPQPNAGPVRGEPPVRRQWHQTVAVGAGDRACPEVAVNASSDRLRVRLRENVARRSSMRFRPRASSPTVRRTAMFSTRTVWRRPLDRRTHRSRAATGLRSLATRREAQPSSLERDAPATGGRIENRQRVTGGFSTAATIANRVVGPASTLERARSSRTDCLRQGARRCGFAPRSILPRGCDRIPVNPEQVQELLPVGVRW